jgi:hypothetical protein
MPNEQLDPTKIYEWFVVDARHTERNGHTFFKLTTACVTEDITITEQFFLEDRRTCPALEHIISLIRGGRKDGVDPLHIFRRSERFYAKVQPIMKSDGTVIWMFNPFSFTGTSKQPEATGATIRDTVIGLVKQKLPREEIIKQLATMGKPYVAEYRKMESAGEVGKI